MYIYTYTIRLLYVSDINSDTHIIYAWYLNIYIYIYKYIYIYIYIYKYIYV